MERSKRANRGRNYAQWALELRLEEEAQSKRRKSKRNQKKDSGGEVLCSCGATEYDPEDTRPMAECEKCLRWQHIMCVIGVNDGSQLPQPYLCFMCKPKNNQDESHDAVQDSPKEPTGSPGPENKVRQSVITALERIFSRQLVPMAITEKLLDASTDVSTYSVTLAKEIEAALYAAHATQETADVGQKYRERFRTLSFNLKNDKNHLLQTQIITREITPEAIATLSNEDMLSPELQLLAQKAKQDAIQGSILKVDEAPRLRKTHKGEEFVETGGEDQGTPQRPLENPPKDPKPEQEKTPKKESPPPHTIEVQYDRGYTEDFDEPGFSENEGDGFVNEEEEEDDFEAVMSRDGPTVVWTGKLFMDKAVDFDAQGFHVGGHKFKPDMWPQVFNTDQPKLTIQGKLDAKVADEYLEKIAKTRVVAAMGVLDVDDPAAFSKLRSLYTRKSRYGVLIDRTAIVKDAYLIPFSKESSVPEYLELTADEKLTLDDLLDRKGELLLCVYVLPAPNLLFSN